MRIGNEAGGGLLRPVQIAHRQSRATDGDLADDTRRQRPPLVVENVDGGVRHGAADRRDQLRILLRDIPRGGADRRFRGAIDIDEPTAAALAQQIPQLRGQGFPAAGNAFQARAAVKARLRQNCMQHRRDSHRVGDLVARHDRRDLPRVETVALRRDDQGAARGCRHEHFLDGRIEGGRHIGQNSGRLPDVHDLRESGDAAAQGRMAADDAFRPSGGSGGVDDVGRILRSRIVPPRHRKSRRGR